MIPRPLICWSVALAAGLLCPLFADEKPPASATSLSFGLLEQDVLPADWRFVGGAWRTKPLARPTQNRKALAAVTSDHHVAFPSISKTKNGTLLVVYREGSTHASGKPDDGRVMLVRSTDGGKTWAPPELVADDPTMDDRNAAISAMGDGTLCVIFDKYLKADGPAAHHWAWLTTSKDEGRTWSAPVKVSKTEDVHTRSPAIDLGDGTWLVPYSESTDSPTAASFFAIFDPKTGAAEEIAATPRGQRNVADETAVVRAANGDLVALIRSNDDPELFQCVSKDSGRTWSKCVPSGIPSQFTPADLIRLGDGRLAATFSFRERRDERMVLSGDHGATWDVENSVDVFDGTPSVGGDRSYPASVQLDESTIGTVIYETKPYPTGGHIRFITTPLAAFDAPKEMTLYQGDANVEAAFALWPARIGGDRVEFTYRFTGRFGPSPHRVGLLLDFKDPKNYTALEFQMGVGNQVQLVECVAGQSKTSRVQEAQGDWYQDGNPHRLGVRRDGQQWVFTIDGNAQFAVPVALGTPRGIVVGHAAVAVYDVTWPDGGPQASR